MDNTEDPRLPPRISFPQVASSSKVSFQTSRRGPETTPAKRRCPRVISLSAYCIKALYLAGIHNISDLETCWARRSYHSASVKKAVVELLPCIPLSLLGIHERKGAQKERLPTVVMDDPNVARLDVISTDTIPPQLWGLLNALIIPSTLPPILRHFSLPITDEHVPSLQTCSILSTATLSLLTHVSFSSPGQRIQITDDSLLQLRTLACLTILDLSATPINSSGVLRLIASMRARLPSKISPWRLRVLNLRRTFVDDEVLLGDRSGLSLRALPMLCAIDLRDTSVSFVACKTFRQSWGSSSPIPPQLFHPTPSGVMMETISRLINQRGSTAKISTHDKCEHPMLLLDRLHPPMEQKHRPLDSRRNEGSLGDLKLRSNTSGVIVLTNTNIILGNVSEVSGNHEEGTAGASFTVNTATIAAQESKSEENDAQCDYLGQERPDLHAETSSQSPSYYDDERERYTSWDDESEHDDQTAIDQDDEEYSEPESEPLPSGMTPPEDQLTTSIEQGFIMYREPPDLTVLLQLDRPPDATQGSKKRPRSNETFQVKRFKGPIMSQILGPTASSRRP